MSVSGNGTGREKRLVPGWLKTALSVIAVIGTVMLLLPTHTAQSSQASPGDIWFLSTGVGEKFIILTTLPNQRGGTDCTPGKPVEVLAAIAGGRAGNSVYIEAVCGGVVVASTTAYDQGVGFGQGTQVAGKAECHIFPGGGNPPSEWIAKCHFYN